MQQNGDPTVQYEVIDDCTQWGGEGGFNQHASTTYESVYNRLAGYGTNNNDAPFMASGSIVTYNNCTLFNTSGNGALGNTFFGLAGYRTFNDSFLSTANETGDQIAAYIYNRCTFGCTDRLIELNRPSSTYTDCEFGTFGTQGVSTALTSASDVVTKVELINCNFVSGLTVEDQFQDVGETPAQSTFLITNKDNDLEQQELYLRSGSVIRDNAQLIRSRSSIKFNPKIANTEHFKIYNIPATSGVSTVFRFGLRYDANFGTATPPTVEVSGLGITPQTFTAGGSANTDDEQTITVTPATTGNLTVKVAGTSANTNGNFWFSGMTASPFITWTQHYGYRYNPTVATLIVDPVVVLSESGAGALSGLAYGANNLAITAARSTSELYDWFKQYEAGNQLDPIFTSTDGNNFTVQSGDTITLGVSGDITGATGKAIAFAGAGELILTDAGNNIDGLTVSGDASIDAAISTFTDVSVTGTADFSVAGTYALDGGTWNEVTNSSGGAVIINLTNSADVTTNTGPSITVNYVRDISITGLVANSRIQLYNVTTATEIYNAVVAGTTYSATYNEGVEYSTGDAVRLRVTNVQGVTAYMEYTASSIAGASGFSFLVSQELCPVYNDFGVDGSTLTTTFDADYVSDEVDIIVGADFSASDFYSWWAYNEDTEQGIREFFGGVTPVDQGNFLINNSIVDIYFDNTTATNVAQLDNRRVYRADGTRPVKSPTTGGGGVDIEWRSPVLIADSASIQTELTNIYTDTQRVDALIEDSSGDRYTAKAIDQAFS